MPTIDWLKKEFSYGYDSGNILSLFANKMRRKEETAIGGNYKKIFLNGLCPFLNKKSKVLELGPGMGAWSRAILKKITEGELTTVDFQDVKKWLKPEQYNKRLRCIQISNNKFEELENDYFDVFWSFGVLCHNNQESINVILSNAISKVKRGGYAIHEYGDWEKLDKYGWQKGGVPSEFKDLPDDKIWWPRNNKKIMSGISENAGWKVITADQNLMQRDSIIVLQRI